MIHNASHLLRHLKSKHFKMVAWPVNSKDCDTVHDYRLNSHGQIFACPYQNCDKIFFKYSDFKTHLEVHVGPCTTSVRSQNKTASKKSKFQCLHPNCNVLFNSLLLFKIHRLEIHQVQPRCEECKKDFTDMIDWYNHMQKHASHGGCKCEVCEKNFYSLYAWANHVKLHLLKLVKKNSYVDNLSDFDKEANSCSYVGRIDDVATNELRNNHSTCTCDICYSSFASICHLEIHVCLVHIKYKFDNISEVHIKKESDDIDATKQIQHYCFLCGIMFHKEDDLFSHYIVHKVPLKILSEVKACNINLLKHHNHSAMPKLGSVSNKTLGKVNNKKFDKFQDETKKDSLNGTFGCFHPNCNVLFNSVFLLKIHMFKSHSILPLCQSCNTSYTSMREWYDHLLKHSWAKTCKCEFCYRKFNSLCSWSTHMRLHLLSFANLESNNNTFDLSDSGNVATSINSDGQLGSDNIVTNKQQNSHLTHVTCALCQKSVLKSRLEIHVSHVHIKYALDSSSVAHVEKVSDNSLINQTWHCCFFCGQMFDDQDALFRHYLGHKVSLETFSETKVNYDTLAVQKKQKVPRSLKKSNSKQLAACEMPAAKKPSKKKRAINNFTKHTNSPVTKSKRKKSNRHAATNCSYTCKVCNKKFYSDYAWYVHYKKHEKTRVGDNANKSMTSQQVMNYAGILDSHVSIQPGARLHRNNKSLFQNSVVQKKVKQKIVQSTLQHEVSDFHDSSLSRRENKLTPSKKVCKFSPSKKAINCKNDGSKIAIQINSDNSTVPLYSKMAGQQLSLSRYIGTVCNESTVRSMPVAREIDSLTSTFIKPVSIFPNVYNADIDLPTTENKLSCEDIKPFLCSICNELCSSKEQFNLHLLSRAHNEKCNLHSLINKVHEGGQVQIDGYTKYICSICNADFTVYPCYLEHLQKHLGNRLSEERLLYRTSSRWFIPRSSRNQITNSKQKYSCWLCRKSYMTKFALSQHVKIHQKLTRPNLSIADKSTTTKCSTFEAEHLQKISNPIKCPNCNKIFAKPSYLKKHLLDKCQVMPSNFEDSEKLLDPKSSANKCLMINANSDKCHICNRKFSEQLDLKRHMHCVHKDIKKSNKHQVTHPNFGIVDKFSTPKSTTNELLTINSDLSKCHNCNKTFSKSSHLKKHMLLMHENVKTPDMHQLMHTNLKVADKTLTSEYPTNVRCTINSKPNKCHICKKTFFKPSYLKRHLLLVHKDVKKSYNCSMARSNFRNVSKPLILKGPANERLMVNSWHSECQDCNKTFSRPQDFKRHMLQLHKGVKKPYKCEKSFMNKDVLNDHVLTHADEKNSFKCEKCNKSFVTTDLLNKHLSNHRVHHNKCSICSKVFSKPWPLKRHIFSVHKDVKKWFKCEVCSKSFVNKELLDTHLISHDNINTDLQDKHTILHENKKPFLCQVCGKSFVCCEELNIHALIHNSTPVYISECRIILEKIDFKESKGNEVVIFDEYVPEINRDSQFKCQKECEDNSFKFLQRKKKVELQEDNTKQPNIHEYSSVSGDKHQEDSTKQLDIHEYSPASGDEHQEDGTNQPNICESSPSSGDAIKKEEKVYWCEICDKIFMRQTQYNYHVKMHCENVEALDKNSEQYECNICLLIFNSLLAFANHTKIHSTEPKKYHCTKCGMNFGAQKSFKRHMKSHIVKNVPSGKSDTCKFKCTISKGIKNYTDCHQTEIKNSSSFLLQSELVTSTVAIADTVDKNISKSKSEAFALDNVNYDNLQQADDYEEDLVLWHCDVCSRIFANKVSLTLHLIVHTSVGCHIYKCQHCDALFGNKKQLDSHERDCGEYNTASSSKEHDEDSQARSSKVHEENEPATSSNFRDETLGIQTEQFEQSQQYLGSSVKKRKFKNHKVRFGNRLTPNASKIYICKVCGRTIIGFKSYKKHRYSHNKKGVQRMCEICGKFCFYKGLKRHILTHSKEKPLELKGCPDNIDNMQSKANIDCMANKPDKVYICKFCGRAILSLKSFKRHCYNHKKQGSQRMCEICGKLCFHKQLKRHMLIHSMEKPFKCNICGMKFARNDHLNKHLRTHSNSDSYMINKDCFECLECHKKFNEKSSLKKHLYCHRQVESIGFECAICHKKFPRKYALTRHVQTHTNLNSFECNICHKLYTRKDRLSKHIRSHSDSTPSQCVLLKCQSCYFEDVDVDNFNKHQILHTTAKYHCDICFEPFATSLSLMKHSRYQSCLSKTSYENVNRNIECVSVAIETLKSICKGIYFRDNQKHQYRKHYKSIEEVNYEETGDDNNDACVENQIKHDLMHNFERDLTVLKVTSENDPNVIMNANKNDKLLPINERSNFESHEKIATTKDSLACFEDQIKFDVTKRENKNNKTECLKNTEPAANLHICCICKKAIAGGKNKLARHMRTHEQPFDCIICYKKHSRKGHLLRHLKTHVHEPKETEAQGYACPMCGKEFTQKNSLIRHLQTHTLTNSFECYKCHKLYSCKDDFDQHIRSHSKSRFSQRILLKCQLCYFEDVDKDDFNKHQIFHKTTKYHCDVCFEPFSSSLSLMKHSRYQSCLNNTEYKNVSKDAIISNNQKNQLQANYNSYSLSINSSNSEEVIKCNDIPFLLKESDDNNSSKIETDDDEYRCSELETGDGNKCSKVESQKECEPILMEIAHNQSITNVYESDVPFLDDESTKDSFECFNDEIKFKNRPSYNNNNKTKFYKNKTRAEKMLTCRICNKLFSGNKQSFKRHVENHFEKEKKFACNICSKKFSRKDHLLRHMNVHCKDPTEGYECSTCHKKFSRHYTLILHEQTHAQLKSFECPICLKLCSLKDELDKHIRSHIVSTSPQYFLLKCQSCYFEAVDEDNFKNHNILHQTAKYHCDVCFEPFSSSLSFMKHSRYENCLINREYKNVGKDVTICDNQMLPLREYNNTHSVTTHLNDNEEVVNYNDLPIFLEQRDCGPTVLVISSDSSVSSIELSSDSSDADENDLPLVIKENCNDNLERFKDRMKLDKKQGKNLNNEAKCLTKKNLVGTVPTCPICSKSFTSGMKNLARHMQIHSKSFVCSICNKTLSRKDHLVRHMKTHFRNNNSGVPDVLNKNKKVTKSKDVTSGLRFTCDICGVSVSRKDHLVRHKTRKHAGNMT